jgi:hypothetical protein
MLIVWDNSIYGTYNLLQPVFNGCIAEHHLLELDLGVGVGLGIKYAIISFI